MHAPRTFELGAKNLLKRITMAVSGLDHGASRNLPKLQIEAVMSVPPLKVTEPRRLCQVSVSDTESVNTNPNAKAIIGGCYQMVLYYEKLKEEDRGWFLAGWIRESLGRALLEEPLLAGRIQRKEHDDHGDNKKGLLAIVSNDSGIRLYEARFPMSLSPFLALTEKEQHLEGELAFWKEIDDHTPELSPLFYVQVTKFECGGYSIGISCSLLLADVLLVENFIKKWAEIHNNLLPQNEDHKAPIFYHPLLINEPPLSAVISRTPSKNRAHTTVFKITSKEVKFDMERWRGLGMLCVEEAEKMLFKNVGSDFSVLVKESFKVINVEGCSKSGHSTQVLGPENQIIGTTWHDFGAYDVPFHEGNKPVLVSHWIGSVAGGHVIAFPYPEENVSAVIIVSLPAEI